MNVLDEMQWPIQIPRGNCTSTNFSPGCSYLPKVLGASQLKYVLPKSWLLALLQVRQQMCYCLQCREPWSPGSAGFYWSWIWSHFKMLISCTQWNWGCLGFWSCRLYTDNFTHGTFSELPKLQYVITNSSEGWHRNQEWFLKTDHKFQRNN